MQMNKLKVLMFVAGMTLSAGISRADLLSGCGTCQGSTYLLQYNSTPVGTFGASGKIYDVFLTIDPTNYNSDQTNNLPSQIYIQTVAVKVASSDDFAHSSLAGAPGGVGSWTLENGGLSNSGGTADCDGSGSGFICAQDGITAPVPFSGTYTWEFHYATTDSLLLGSLGSSIKVAYTDGSFNKVGSLVSEDITLQSCTSCGPRTSVPEPASVLLFGTLLGFTGLGLRKWQKA